LDELTRRDFVSFLIRAYPHLSGGADLIPNWHLDAIAYQLERVRLGDCRRLLVTLPPRNLKSIMISVAWVAWCLGRDPSLNFVCVSYSNELSGKHARDCRALVQSTWYRRLFPRTVITASRSAAYDFETTLGGGRLATSIGGTLTGRGGDIIIIDDPLKPEEAMSDTTRDGTNSGGPLGSRTERGRLDYVVPRRGLEHTGYRIDIKDQYFGPDNPWPLWWPHSISAVTVRVLLTAFPDSDFK
jgi:hypothetical protein